MTMLAITSFPSFFLLLLTFLQFGFLATFGQNPSLSPGPGPGPSPSPILSPIPSPSPSPSPSLAPTDYAESVSLLGLRGDLGIRSQYWPRGVDPCLGWVGIVCENGHVVSVRLPGLRRTVKAALSPTPSSLSLTRLQELPFLRELNTSGFPLPGPLPDWLNLLANLRILDFTSSSLNGSIPLSLDNLTYLHTCLMPNNNLSGSIPSSLANLTALILLNLSANHLSGSIPNGIFTLRNLTTIDLSLNLLSGEIPPLISSLESLQSLLLSSNNLTGNIAPELASFIPSLVRLDLSLNSLSGGVPKELGNLTALKSLDLSRNSLNGHIPQELANCKGLEYLSMKHNLISGNLPVSLGGLNHLVSVDFSFNNLTGSLPIEIASLTSMAMLILSNNLFYGPLPSGLANLSNLTKLDISYNYLGGNLPAGLLLNATLSENCLSNVPNQRELNDCQAFYLAQGINFNGTSLGIPASSPQASTEIPSGKNNHLVAILGGVFGGLGLVLLVMVVMFFVLKQEKKNKEGRREPVSRSQKQSFGDISLKLFSLGEKFAFTQLQQATGDFSPSNLLKEGHSGDLYLGSLEGGISIVVKRINLSKVKKDSYLAELEVFSKASHTRLVPLLGYCLEQEEEKLLVYKYMPNQDLSHALQKRTKTNPLEDVLRSIDWITRLKIAIGAAEALTFLHHECVPPLVHRDVQASSILLDDKFEVRLGSLTEVRAATGESHQGVIARLLRISQAAEQVETGMAAPPTCAYDVFCFGKVLLELISGRPGVSGGGGDPAATEAWLESALKMINVYDKESVITLVDPTLIVHDDLLEEVWAMAIVAKSCLHPKPSKRPLMRYILKALENPIKVVREDTAAVHGSARRSSHGSWNAAFFGSWRHSSSEMVVLPGSLREQYLQKSGSRRTDNNGERGIKVGGGSQDSIGQGEVSQRRPGSNEIFPEPLEESSIHIPNTTDSDRQDG